MRRAKMRFRIGTDYKTEFNNVVTALVTQKITDRVERMAVIESLINEYLEATGELPEQVQLERLTNEILYEELSDMHPDKVTNNEFPFLSEWQFDRRRGNEAKLEVADEKHKKPVRRKRSTWENIKIDQQAKIRNEERKEQYRKDTVTIDYTPYQSEREIIDNYLVTKYGAHKLRYSR
jgi:hypothetical protein